MFEYQPTLTGALVTLRPVTIDDRQALFAAASDPQVWALHPNNDRWKPEVFADYFEDGLKSGGALVALERETGRVMGWSRYDSQFVQPGEIEIGWTFLDRAHWGGGWNRDMKRTMLAHAFRFVDRVVFRIGRDNLRSRRAVEKIGAVLDERVMGGNVFYVLPKAAFESGLGAASNQT
jgi:RimJ/RimL family protein N-acetyltransferase